MTTTETVPIPVVGRHSNPPASLVALVAIMAGTVTLLIRLTLYGHSFDLFGDEVIYADLGLSVVRGGFPQFGGPFFLHGPAFFYLEAGWARLIGHQPGVMAQVDQMRVLNVVLAAATAVTMVVLGTRASSLRGGAAAGLLFAVDPFCIRQNDRVLLETSMMLWVMLGYLLFISLIGRSPSRGDKLRAIAAGILFGLAILTKDEAALLTLLPLLACAVLRWGPRRSLILITIGCTVIVYLVYVAVVTANGLFDGLWEAKTAGIQRMLGLVQSSGFHSSGGGSLTSRLVAEGIYFGTTYIALALAVPATILMLRHVGQISKILSLMYCAAAVALAYGLTLGTLEEQELYLLIVPSLLIIPVAIVNLGNGGRVHNARSAEWQRGRSAATVAAYVALGLALSINLVTWVQWYRQPDDGFKRLIGYMSEHVPAHASVAIMDGDIESPYTLNGIYRVGYWHTSAQFSRNHVQYVVVEWATVDEGYSDQTPAQVKSLVARDHVIFSFNGRTYGQLELYKVR